MKAKVLKRITSLGKQLEVGDIVEVSAWRHTKALVSGRYIELIKDESEKPKKAKDEASVKEIPVQKEK